MEPSGKIRVGRLPVDSSVYDPWSEVPMLLRVRPPRTSGLGFVATDPLKPSPTSNSSTSSTSTAKKKDEPSTATLVAGLVSGIFSAGGAVGAGFLTNEANKDIAKRQAQANAQIAAINSQTNIEIARIQAKAAADAAAAQAAMYAADPVRPYVVPIAVGGGILGLATLLFVATR